jgi:phosphopantothenoylcysteine decarboxylase/phosphopantothenate--cysteine ligase
VKCLVTAGPTYESLDQVRRLTNFSTGTLGCTLAAQLEAAGHEVVLLKGYYTLYQGVIRASEVATFTTTADLRSRLQAFSSDHIEAVFHAAAVSDFGFGRVFHRSASDELAEVEAGKLSTRDGALLVELLPTPKIIDALRGFFPDARLIGWKYQVDGTKADAIQAGTNQIERCRTDACVVNGPAYPGGFGLVSTGGHQHFASVAELFTALEQRFLQP